MSFQRGGVPRSGPERTGGSPLRDQTVLLLGASGPAGSAVARRLLAEGAIVFAQGRDLGRLSRLQAFGASTVQGDLRALETRAALLRVAKDAAAVVSFLPPDPALVRSVAVLMRDLPGTNRIHLSSTMVYDRRRDQFDLTERDMRPKGPVSTPYVQAELTLEAACQGSLTILRPGRLIGGAGLSPALGRWAASGPLPLLRSLELQTSVLPLRELSDMIVHLLSAPATGRAHGVFNVASSQPAASREVIEQLCQESGIRYSWRRTGRTGLRAGILIRDLATALPGRSLVRDEIDRLLTWSLTLDTSAFRREAGWDGVARGVRARKV